MRLGGLSYQSGTENRYRYKGKEFHQELGLGLYDYGARMYDPAIGRWNGVDELGDSFQNHSPFNYVMGNPINWIDPDGRMTASADTPQYNLDPVVINPPNNSGGDNTSARAHFYMRLALMRNRYPSSNNIATVDYKDVRKFNDQASQLPYGVGLLYSFTIGSILDASVGFGEVIDEGEYAGGFQGYSQTFRNGSQVWVQTRNGKIINAGVNLIPK